MNNLDRKAKLEKALANYDSDSMFTVENYKGAQIENERLAPLHAALIEAIENLEDIQAWCRDRSATDGTIYAIGLSRSTEALAKIDKALGDVK